MKFIQCFQGSEAWLAARAGAITASRFSDAISTLKKASGDKKPGDPTGAAEKYAGDIAIERISGRPYGEPPKAWVLDRGHEMEARARVAYETRYGLMAEESGVVKTDDDWFGYSTDGLVGDDGLIEVKCPVDTQKIKAMFETGDIDEYVHQIQGGMWITGRKWCDFVSFDPRFPLHLQLFVTRIHRDDAAIAGMEMDVISFLDDVDHMVKQLNSMKAAA